MGIIRGLTNRENALLHSWVWDDGTCIIHEHINWFMQAFGEGEVPLSDEVLIDGEVVSMPVTADGKITHYWVTALDGRQILSSDIGPYPCKAGNTLVVKFAITMRD